MKLIKLENEELSKAVTIGDAYVQVGRRKFMLFEVNEVRKSDYYEVTDPEEERLLLEAMQEDNPSYLKQEILDWLSRSRE